jgi:hypothetical protein
MMKDDQNYYFKGSRHLRDRSTHKVVMEKPKG